MSYLDVSMLLPELVSSTQLQLASCMDGTNHPWMDAGFTNVLSIVKPVDLNKSDME